MLAVHIVLVLDIYPPRRKPGTVFPGMSDKSRLFYNIFYRLLAQVSIATGVDKNMIFRGAPEYLS